MTITALSERVLFSGETIEASVRGKVISAICRTGSVAFDQMVPRVRVQAGCNNTLYDLGCGLLRANWEFSATLNAPGSPGWPFTFSFSGLARVTGPEPAYSLDFFAGGWIQVGADRVAVLASTVAGRGLPRSPASGPSGQPTR